MSNLDERRWQQRLDNFGQALAQLTSACDRERYDDLETQTSRNRRHGGAPGDRI